MLGFELAPGEPLMLNARRLAPRLLLFALSSVLVVSGAARAGGPLYLYDSAGTRIATIDPANPTTGVSARQIVAGAVSTRALPSYSVPADGVLQWNTWVDAAKVDTAGWLVITAEGPYMNLLRVHVSAVYPVDWVEVFRAGDDINGNTKAISATIPLPANTYFRMLPTGTVGANTNYGFETVKATFFPVDR